MRNRNSAIWLHDDPWDKSPKHDYTGGEMYYGHEICTVCGRPYTACKCETCHCRECLDITEAEAIAGRELTRREERAIVHAARCYRCNHLLTRCRCADGPALDKYYWTEDTTLVTEETKCETCHGIGFVLEERLLGADAAALCGEEHTDAYMLGMTCRDCGGTGLKKGG